MSVFFLDEPFEGDRVPTADDLRRATPLPGVTSWMEWSADPEPVSEWLQPDDRVEVHEVAGGFLVLPAALDDQDARAKAEIERQTRPIHEAPLAAGGPVSPRADLAAAMTACGLQLTPWQQRVAEALLDGDPRRLAFTYPKQSGRRSISRVAAAAYTGDPMTAARELSITITADASGAFRAFAAAAEHATHALRIYSEGMTWAERAKRQRRRAIEQRRIRQAMRHIERRAARRQRRAASRAARAAR